MQCRDFRCKREEAAIVVDLMNLTLIDALTVQILQKWLNIEFVLHILASQFCQLRMQLRDLLEEWTGLDVSLSAASKQCRPGRAMPRFA